MKTSVLLILVALFQVSILVGQESLKLSPDGFNSVIISSEELSASELYKKTIDWVGTTFKNPDLVIKSKIEDEKIRIDGHMSNAWYYSSMGNKIYYGLDYTLTISFKDGRYKVELAINRFTDKGATAMHKLSHFYKEDGTIRKMYLDSPSSLENSVNALISSLHNYINNGGVKNEDW